MKTQKSREEERQTFGKGDTLEGVREHWIGCKLKRSIRVSGVHWMPPRYFNHYICTNRSTKKLGQLGSFVLTR